MSARRSRLFNTTAFVLLVALCTASPALSQTSPTPFGDVAHHVVRVDGIRFSLRRRRYLGAAEALFRGGARGLPTAPQIDVSAGDKPDRTGRGVHR
jgi:hypothetical protein